MKIRKIGFAVNLECGMATDFELDLNSHFCLFDLYFIKGLKKTMCYNIVQSPG